MIFLKFNFIYFVRDVGSGVVMGVPGHNENDYEFMNQMNANKKKGGGGQPTIDVIHVYETNDKQEEIFMMNQQFPNFEQNQKEQSITASEIKDQMNHDFSSVLDSDHHTFNPTTTFKMRDWIFSRQRYWGEPIPILFPIEFDEDHNDGEKEFIQPQDPRKDGAKFKIRYDQPLQENIENLPVLLPEIDDYHPMSQNNNMIEDDEDDGSVGVLARCKDWRFVQRPVTIIKNKDGNGEQIVDEKLKWFARETNTMPQWAGSCWYYLRFLDPSNQDQLASKELMRKWLPVDLYMGGQEHATLHLLYARFWHKVLFDDGQIPSSSSSSASLEEPFLKLVHQGMVLASDGDKMSKSKGNVINPDEIVSEFGADVLRLYQMFMGPIEMKKEWKTEQLGFVFCDSFFPIS